MIACLQRPAQVATGLVYTGRTPLRSCSAGGWVGLGGRKARTIGEQGEGGGGGGNGLDLVAACRTY